MPTGLVASALGQQRRERYNQVMELHRQGHSIRQIARLMGMHRETVRKFLRSGQFPERATRKFSRRIDAFVDFLRRRWGEGCRDAVQLTRELRPRGFDGSYHMVRRWVAGWRSPNDPPVTGRQPMPKDHKPCPCGSGEKYKKCCGKNA